MLVVGLALIYKLSPAQAANTAAPSAQVTFYSGGKTFSSGLPGKQAAFFGNIFDNQHELALLERHRFVTFNLTPGIHTLSSNYWMTNHADGGARMTMDLAAGGHYFIRAFFEGTRLWGSQVVLAETTCEDAKQLSTDTKPLEQKHFRRDGVQLAVAESKFPQCP